MEVNVIHWLEIVIIIVSLWLLYIGRLSTLVAGLEAFIQGLKGNKPQG